MSESIDESQVQHMDIAEFRRDGYLQELNRRFLHPLGLALSVRRMDDGTEELAGIWDCRDDPEGIRFGPGAIDPDKAHRIDDEQDRRFVPRFDRLGYMVQPATEETE